MQEFDRDKDLLNCANGTIDLNSMQFREHNPEDRLTKIIPVEYIPGAKSERFDRFISEIMSGDMQRARFLQKSIGYALGGDTRFECMFFLYGATTRNGKGTLMESILRVMGDYGKSVRAEARIGKMDVIMQRLYEDNVEGKISDERYARMSASYETEQKQLESRKAELVEFIDSAKEQRLNTDSFLDMVRKYMDITELSAEIIRSFVEKIEVLQPEKVPGTRTKKQTIVIYWNFIGAVEIPDEHEKTA